MLNLIPYAYFNEDETLLFQELEDLYNCIYEFEIEKIDKNEYFPDFLFDQDSNMITEKQEEEEYDTQSSSPIYSTVSDITN